jgi:hypothetical protein
MWACHAQAEKEFFDRVTDVSGILYPVPKDERKAAAVEYLKTVEVPRHAECSHASCGSHPVPLLKRGSYGC